MSRWALVSLMLTGGWACGVAQTPVRSADSPRPRSAARLVGADEVRKRLGLTPAYDHVRGIEALKIAVLDFGFEGLGLGREYLPDRAVLVEHYDPEFVRRFDLGDPEYRKSFAPGNAHGRQMAQIVWGLTGFRVHGPRFFLLNANGPTMLRRAVRYAIEAKVDVILFSATFEGGGNGDGRGAINSIVAHALAAGIIWINASGNFGKHVYNGPLKVGPDGYLTFRSGSPFLRFRNRLDENTLTITLTWNDYREEEDAGTDKDLDLLVEDDRGERLGASELVQVTGNRAAGEGETRNPRERVVLADLPAAPERDYRIRIRAKKGAFDSSDRIRVLITAGRGGPYPDAKTGKPVEAVEFADASPGGEVFPPADHPLVITVGDRSESCSVGPTADSRVKPDVVIEDAHALFSNGDTLEGSSVAAAYYAAAILYLKAAEPDLQNRHLLWLARYRAKTTHGVATRRTSASARSATNAGPRSILDRRLWRAPSVNELVSRDTRTLKPLPAKPNPAAQLDLDRLSCIIPTGLTILLDLSECPT